MNQVTLLGRIGTEPELIQTENNLHILKFSLATNDKRGDALETTWHRVVVFGKTAEINAKNLHRGCEALVLGKISNKSYTNKEGVKVYTSEVVGFVVRPTSIVGGNEETLDF